MSLAEMAYQETQTEDGKRRAAHAAALAAAEQDIVKAALAWRVAKTRDTQVESELLQTSAALDVACIVLIELRRVTP